MCAYWQHGLARLVSVAAGVWGVRGHHPHHAHVEGPLEAWQEGAAVLWQPHRTHPSPAPEALLPLHLYAHHQVPNFLLAAPTLLLSLWGIYSYAATKPRTFWTGGLLPPVPTPQPPPSILGIGYTPLRRQQKEAARRKSESGAQSTPSQSPSRGNGTLVHRAAGAAADAATGTAGGRTRSPQPGGTQRAPSPGLFPAQPARSSRAQAPAAAASALMQRPHTPLPGRSSGSSSNGLMLSSCGGGFYSPDVAVFIYQWAFMVLFAALVMHVQVATRFLSTLLPWYWWAAQLLLQRKGVAPWLWGYCFGYMALGAVLFPNFLPWT